MQLLTTTGYKNIEDCVVGDQLIAYDIFDGSIIINKLLEKKWFSPDMFQDEYSEPEQVVDEDGNPVFDEDGNPVMSEPVLIKTKEQVFIDTYGELEFYSINSTWQIYENQSVWANMNVCHAKNLKVGDVIYDDDDNDITITSLVKNTASGWWRLSVSGDHSYIMDNLTLHNASRYWVGGGASANWNATGNTNWGSSSGGTNNASVPTTTDDVIFDGAGVAGNSNSTISATITILSLNITAGYTSTMTHNAVLTIAGNWTFVNTYTIAGTSGIILSTGGNTINSNNTTWPNDLTLPNTAANTALASNLTVLGLLTHRRASLTGNYNLTINGGLTSTGLSTYTFSTYKIILKGGTWSFPNGNSVLADLDIDGNVTISGSVAYSDKTLTYLSGTITTTGSTLTLGNTVTITLNTNGITWNNITSNSSTKTISLTSNLSIGGLLTISGTTTINRTTAETVTCAGGMTINAGLSGTAEISWTGGTWTQNSTSYRIGNNLTIAGNVTFSGANTTYGTGTLTYLSGKISLINNVLNFSTSATILGFNKSPLRSILVTAGQTLTFDQLPVGSEDQILEISSTGANYTIAFTDTIERIGRNVAISGATLSRPMQLLLATNTRFNTNRSTSTGIRYCNQSPNGIAKNVLPVSDRSITGGFGGLVCDPSFQRQG